MMKLVEFLHQAFNSTRNLIMYSLMQYTDFIKDFFTLKTSYCFVDHV